MVIWRQSMFCEYLTFYPSIFLLLVNTAFHIEIHCMQSFPSSWSLYKSTVGVSDKAAVRSDAAAELDRLTRYHDGEHLVIGNQFSVWSLTIILFQKSEEIRIKFWRNQRGLGTEQQQHGLLTPSLRSSQHCSLIPPKESRGPRARRLWYSDYQARPSLYLIMK